MAVIKTERLTIKSPELKDVDAMVALVNNWEITKWLSNVPYPYLQSDGIDFVKRSKQKHETGSSYNYLVFFQDALVGGVGLSLQENGIYNLGYWVGKQYWGQGIATEVCCSILAFAFNDLKQTKIQAGYFEGNDASANVLKKLGFVHMATKKLFSISQNKDMCDYWMSLERKDFQNLLSKFR